MASEAQLSEALKRADAAGNTADARALAQAIGAMRKGNAGGLKSSFDAGAGDAMARAGGVNGSYAQGLGSSVAQGAMGGLADEAAGVAKGYSLNLIDPMGAAGGAMAVAEGLTGRDDLTNQGYKTGRDQFRQVNEDFRQNYPITSTAAEIAGALPTLAVGGFGQGSTWLGRLGSAGATGAAYGAVYGAGNAEGGPEQRAMGAAGGAIAGGLAGPALELVAAPIIRGISAFTSRAGRPPILTDANGQLTRDGIATFRLAGLNPEDATPQIIAAAQQHMAGGAAPGASAFKAVAESLPVPVQPTVGQATGDMGQMAREIGLAKNTEGAGAGAIMRGSREAQDQALRDNQMALQERLAGGGPVIAQGEGGAMASGRLASMAETARAGKSAAYTEAERLTPPTPLADRPFGGDNRGAIDQLNGGRRSDTPDPNFEISKRADFPQPMSKLMMSKAWDALTRADVTAENAIGVRNIIARFGRMADEGPLPIADIFQMRRSLTGLQGGIPSADTVAARAAKTEIDNMLDYAVKQNLFNGDTAAIDAWKSAIAKNRDYAQTYKSDDIVGDLVETNPGQGGALKVKPEEAANYILGTSALNMGKRDLASGLAKLKNVLGPESPEWHGIRQEVFIKIANKSRGASTPNGNLFSGANLAKEWETFLRQSPEVARTVFSEAERRDIGNWVNVARKLTVKEPNLVAPSTSPDQMRRLLSGAVMRRIPFIGPWIDGLKILAQDAAGTRAAGQAVGGALPRAAAAGVPVPAAIPAAGGIAAQDQLQGMR